LNKAEVLLLMAEIQDNYPNFDSSDENIERHYKYLLDFSFEEALKNVVQHIKTNDFPPKISHIRGHLADVKHGEISKQQAEQYNKQLAVWSLSSVAPQKGYWDQLKEILRGEHGE